MMRMMKNLKSVLSTAALFDVVVAMVSVPLLVIFGLLLESNMRGEWTLQEDTRWNVLGLGLALLFVSLLVCCYVIHRLGICIWQAQNRDPPQHTRSGVACSTDSQLHLVVDGELPPSYASILTMEMPPAYCHVIMEGSQDKTLTPQETTVSETHMTSR